MEPYGRRLFSALVGLAHNFQHIRFFEDLSNNTFMTLCVIQHACREPGAMGITISELSEKMEVSKPAITRTVNQLEERGMAARGGKKDDRRCVYVVLTDEGRETLREAESCVSKIMDSVAEKMGEDDAGEAIRLIKRMGECYLEYEREQEESQ